MNSSRVFQLESHGKNILKGHDLSEFTQCESYVGEKSKHEGATLNLTVTNKIVRNHAN